MADDQGGGGPQLDFPGYPLSLYVVAELRAVGLLWGVKWIQDRR